MRSASADSPMPLRRSVTEARSSPTPRSRRRGRTSSRHIGCISDGGPGSATRRRPSGRSTHQPGAVPRPLPIDVALGINQACLRLMAGMGTPRRAKSPASHASRSGSTVGVSPQAPAMASRVRSSGVGPSPPVTTTRSVRARPSVIAAVTASRSSGRATMRSIDTPQSVRSRARSPEFVSRVPPVVSSVPTARTVALASVRCVISGR